VGVAGRGISMERADAQVIARKVTLKRTFRAVPRRRVRVRR
jgi:hypothetical protein